VPDNQVSISDLSAIVGYLSPTYATTTPIAYVAPIPDGWECADVSGLEAVPDGQLSISDLSAIVGYLSPTYATTTPIAYVGPCMPDPNP
jgi:hypothetical protein